MAFRGPNDRQPKNRQVYPALALSEYVLADVTHLVKRSVVGSSCTLTLYHAVMLVMK